MRGEKLTDLVKLALALSASAEGMTLDEMAAFSGVGRRTVERRRDVLDLAVGPLERIEDGRQVRFRLTGRTLGSFATSPTSQELAELENAARVCERAGDTVRAETLRSLHRKIAASLRQTTRVRLAVDTEAQLQSEALARQVGPRPYADPNVLATLRQALLARVVVTFRYRGEPNGPARLRRVVPYGLLLGPRYYLVARAPSHAKPVMFRLDRIEDLQATGEPGAPPIDFDLNAFAMRSFGVFQEEPQEVVLRFEPAAAADARAFVFHPTQILSDQSDGGLRVSFHSGGLLQIAFHLMTWGPAVTVLTPESLRSLLWEHTEALYSHCRKSRYSTPGSQPAAQ